HLLVEAGRRGTNDDAARAERVRPVELALKPGDVRLLVDYRLVFLAPGGADGGVLGLIEGNAVQRGPLGQTVVPDAVFDRVAGHTRGGMPVPGDRAMRELAAGRVALDRGRDAVCDHRPAAGDRVGEVVGGLRRGVVVKRHPVLGADGLGRYEAAVVDTKPALGGAVPVVVDAGPARIADRDAELRPAFERHTGSDHELRRRALGAVQRVSLAGLGGRQLRGARGRQ